jgi:hypothetical protein
MMFFKLASLQYSSYYAAINTIQSYNLNDHSILPNNFSSMKMNLAYMFKIPEVLSDSKQSIAEKKILSTNPTNELFRHLWQQDIFLSINRKSLYKYNLDISSVNISKYQKRQKSLLSKFSKALFSGSIQCALTSSLNVSKKSSVSVNYSWSKVLKIQVLKTQNLYANSNYLNNLQDVFNNKINAKYLPVFAISNHLGQMIMAEPSRNFYSAQHVNDLGPVIKKMYHGFFFINYEDAKEYLEYVQSTYNLKNESLKNPYIREYTKFF